MNNTGISTNRNNGTIRSEWVKSNKKKTGIPRLSRKDYIRIIEKMGFNVGITVLHVYSLSTQHLKLPFHVREEYFVEDILHFVENFNISEQVDLVMSRGSGRLSQDAIEDIRQAVIEEAVKCKKQLEILSSTIRVIMSFDGISRPSSNDCLSIICYMGWTVRHSRNNDNLFELSIEDLRIPFKVRRNHIIENVIRYALDFTENKQTNKLIELNQEPGLWGKDGPNLKLMDELVYQAVRAHDKISRLAAVFAIIHFAQTDISKEIKE